MHKHRQCGERLVPVVTSRRGLVALAAVLACGAAGLAAGPAAQAAAVHSRPASAAVTSQLDGVSADSATDAWAVGIYYPASGAWKSLIDHWNGTSWTKVASPSPAGWRVTLNGVSADSATDAWAVGTYYVISTGAFKGIILHWNGTSWTQMSISNPGAAFHVELLGVSADSATDAWAVGYYDKGVPAKSLILHWNGTTWSKVASPNPGLTNDYNTTLQSVSAVSPIDVWATGYYYNSSDVPVTLMLHWNGTKWSKVASPNPGATYNTTLDGVSMDSATDGWASGFYKTSSGDFESLMLHWNGTKWSKVASPDPGQSYTFPSGVSADSGTDAWAVGDYTNGSGDDDSLIVQWNGTSWTQVASPNPGKSSTSLSGVSADSATDAWAVGSYDNGNGPSSLIEHWDGTSWTQVAAPTP